MAMSAAARAKEQSAEAAAEAKARAKAAAAEAVAKVTKARGVSAETSLAIRAAIFGVEAPADG